MANNFKVACKDIDPTIDCGFKATGSTDNEVVAKMLNHMRKEHMDKVMGKSDEDIRGMIRNSIKQT